MLHDPTSSCRLGIPQIDNLLDLFSGSKSIPPQQQIRQSESSDMFDRPENDNNVHHMVPVKAPPIIEITSPGSNDGKSQLLYYITAISILPASIGEIHIGGRDAAVVILDTESRFLVPRLVQIMHHIISTKLSTIEPSDPNSRTAETDSLIQESLKHVQIYTPQSLSSLITTITQLPTTLFHHSNISKDKHLAAILLDSPSSFFWQEKAAQETALLPPDTDTDTDVPPTAAGKAKRQNAYAHLASAIKQTSASLRAPVIYSTWNLSTPAQGQRQEMAIRPSLLPPWQGLPCLRLVVARRGIRKFPIGMTGEEAAQLKGRREEAVRRGGFDVRVNWWGSEGWSERVREGVRRGGDGFEIFVSGRGVVIE